MEAFMGTILPVGFSYPPRGWAFCNGQLMSIAQNSALFALLGTTYGGDGQTTFGLPDLRGRVVVGSQGAGPGISNVQPGEMSGTNNVTVLANGNTVINLTAANLPAHTHPATLSLSGLTATTAVDVSTGATGSVNVAAGNTLSQATSGPSSAAIFTSAPVAPVALGGVNTTITGSGTVTVEANTGGGQAAIGAVTTQATISVMQPYTGINYIIALEGIFPSRN
ncbi:MAG: tail fiber protein [Pseudomonadota bacterium]